MQYYPDPGVWYAVANPNHAMTIAQCSDWWCGMLLADVSYWSMMYWWTCMHDEWNVLMNDEWWTCMHDEWCIAELVCMMNDVLMNLYAWWMMYWWTCMHDEWCIDELVCMMNGILMNSYGDWCVMNFLMQLLMAFCFWMIALLDELIFDKLIWLDFWTDWWNDFIEFFLNILKFSFLVKWLVLNSRWIAQRNTHNKLNHFWH